MESLRETKRFSAFGAAPCAAGTLAQGGQGRQHSPRHGGTESHRCSCVVPGPQRPPVSKLPNGSLPGQKLWRVPVLCLLTQALWSRSVLRSLGKSWTHAGGGLPDATRRVGDIVPQECHCLEFSCFQLPVATVVISFAVSEQSVGSILLHVFLFRRTTGQILKEYVLQRWVGCDEPHAAGPGC